MTLIQKSRKSPSEKCNQNTKTSFWLLQDVCSSCLEDALFKTCFETFFLKESSIEART